MNNNSRQRDVDCRRLVSLTGDPHICRCTSNIDAALQRSFQLTQALIRVHLSTSPSARRPGFVLPFNQALQSPASPILSSTIFWELIH